MSPTSRGRKAVIKRNVVGDILDPSNECDVIIGMNTALDDVKGIGLRFVKNIIRPAALELGSVISFRLDEKRKLHMIICHQLGPGGWEKADKYVRFGMDYLDHLTGDRHHSIVEIGTGRVGRRDRADAPAIHLAMSLSFLPVDLYIFRGTPMEAIRDDRPPLQALFAWSPVEGHMQMPA